MQSQDWYEIANDRKEIKLISRCIRHIPIKLRLVHTNLILWQVIYMVFIYLMHRYLITVCAEYEYIFSNVTCRLASTEIPKNNLLGVVRMVKA